MENELVTNECQHLCVICLRLFMSTSSPSRHQKESVLIQSGVERAPAALGVNSTLTALYVPFFFNQSRISDLHHKRKYCREMNSNYISRKMAL